METRPTVPNQSGIRIAAFYDDLDGFEERLRDRNLTHWADCLGQERSKSSYVGDAVLRSSHVLKAIETRYPRSGLAREARHLLDECDAIWRGDMTDPILESAAAEPDRASVGVTSPSVRWPHFAPISPLRSST